MFWNKKSVERDTANGIKYRALFETSRDAIMTVVPDRGFISGNPATIKMFGCRDESEFISQSPASLSPKYQPDGLLSSEKAQKMMAIALEKGMNFFEWTHKRLNGEEFPATVLLSTMEFHGEKILQATVRDITEETKAREKLLESGREWDRTFNAITDLVFIQGIDRTIIKANDAFLKMFGLKASDVIGRKCYEIVHKSHTPWPACPMEKTKADMLPHTAVVDDPRIGIPLLVTTSPIFDDKGKVTGIVHIAKDISGMKKTQDELEKKIEDLERFRRITVDRELKMKELKARIAELETRLGKG